MATNFSQKSEKTPKHPQETLLEFVEEDSGKLVLREAKNTDEVLVSIDFSEKVKTMLGDDIDLRYIGEHMIQAAFAAVMKQQLARWHANVLDEEPVHYS